MKSSIIVIKDNKVSEAAAEKCMKSTKIFIETFDAITPDQVDNLMEEHGIKWTYPWDSPTIDFASGLKLNPYQTPNPKTRIACFLSHYILWKECSQGKDPYMILEHDAIFVRDLDLLRILDNKYQIVGINNPLGATRRSQQYYDVIRRNNDFIQQVPVIDEVTVPQGLAGNSAYIIKPKGARKMLELVDEYGAWPNDALMCKQLVGSMLGVTKTFYTKVQGTPSTTS